MSNDHASLPLNVRLFGAAGDGQTDDTTAIQTAIDAAAEGPRQVYFPAGVYPCSNIQLRPHITLAGCATWTYWYFKGSVLVLNDDRATSLLDATGAKGVVIDGLALDGQHLGQGIHGISVHTHPFPKFDENGAGDDDICIDQSLVRNFSGDGIHLDGIWVFTIRHSMVANNLENGIYFHGFDGYVLACWLSANRKAGYGADQLNASVTMTANRIEWNQTGGIIIRGGNGYNITGNFFDRSGGPAIQLQPRDVEPCHTFTITGNILRRSGAHGAELGGYANSHLFLEGCRGLVCTGNTMSVGQDDGEQGEFTPAYGIVYGHLQDCIIKDNVLHHGALQQLVVDLGNNNEDTTIIKDNVGSLMKLQR